MRVFINYRRVPVMLGKVTLHALCEIDIGVILLCQMSRAHELFVNIYIMCFCIIYQLLVLIKHGCYCHEKYSFCNILFS